MIIIIIIYNASQKKNAQKTQKNTKRNFLVSHIFYPHVHI